MTKLPKTLFLTAALAVVGAMAVPLTAHAITPVMPAPELDPSSAFAALTLFSGALALVRSRRVRKK